MTEPRFDDYANAMTGLGTIRDKHTAVTFLRRRRLDRCTLEALYEQDPIVARIIDMPIDTAFRTPFRVTSAAASPEQIATWLDDLQVTTQVIRLLKWGRLYGGALGMIPATGSGKPDQALTLREGVAVHPMAVVAADDAYPQYMDTAFGSRTYGRVLEYEVVALGSTSVRLHWTRAITHEPIELPPDTLLRQGRYWGPSIIERCFDALGKDGAAASSAAAMMYVASILLLRLKDLRTKLEADSEKTRSALEKIRQNLDSLGLLALDKDDEASSLDLSATGAHDLVEKFRDRLAASVDGMPREILLNESPTGLRGGELSGAQALFFGYVGALRENVIEPILDRWIEIVLRTRGLRDDWSVEWTPLWDPPPSEIAATDKTKAEAASLRTAAGVTSPDEEREALGLTGPADTAAALELDPMDVAAAESAASSPNAMDGAQVQGLVAIAEKVTARLLTREQAIAIIRVAYPSAAAIAEQVVGPPPEPGAEVDAPPLSEAGEFVTVQEAAERLGVHTRTITAALAKDDAPNMRAIGSKRVVSLRELWDFMNREQIAAGHGEEEARRICGALQAGVEK